MCGRRRHGRGSSINNGRVKVSQRWGVCAYIYRVERRDRHLWGSLISIVNIQTWLQHQPPILIRLFCRTIKLSYHALHAGFLPQCFWSAASMNLSHQMSEPPLIHNVGIKARTILAKTHRIAFPFSYRRSLARIHVWRLCCIAITSK